MDSEGELGGGLVSATAAGILGLTLQLLLEDKLEACRVLHLQNYSAKLCTDRAAPAAAEAGTRIRTYTFILKLCVQTDANRYSVIHPVNMRGIQNRGSERKSGLGRLLMLPVTW